MAPEYALHGHFSVKSDVFSYGVMILEVVTGHKNATGQGSSTTSVQSDDQEHLITYVWNSWSRGRALQVLDECLQGRCILQEALRCIHVGILCVQRNVSERPSISDVVLMLSDQSVILPTPSTPAFVFPVHDLFSRSDVDVNDIIVLRTDVSRVTSVNTISGKEIEPR
ncbi:hypothetical protein LUZ60_001359 [Juncus effusus]|nr:hypothetical protein LUZ60_001359 [Juncus effusus]